MARERNGWIDNGRPISNAAKRCPNCHSTEYTETVSMEKCTTCGLEFDYWGDGGNAVYNTWSANKQRAEEWANRFREEEETEDGGQYDWQSEDDS